MRTAGLWITLWCFGFVPGSLLRAAETLDAFVPAAADWLTLHDDGVPLLRLKRRRRTDAETAAPIQFALAQTPEVGHVTVDADVMPLGRALLIVFA